MKSIYAHARVVIHFHPDRFGIKPMPVAEALLKEGVDPNQFEIGPSTGGPSAFPGGGVTRGNARCSVVPITKRGLLIRNARDGALELVRYADGPISRLGSCYFVLRPTGSGRTLITFAGSEDPRATERLGMIGQMDNVMAALFAEIEAGGMAAPPWPPFVRPRRAF